MTTVDKYQEAAYRKERDALYLALIGGLDQGVSRAGGELLGFSLKFGRGDCLLTLRAVFPAGGVIAFVGASSVAQCFIKASREASRDALKWKVDKYRANGG